MRTANQTCIECFFARAFKSGRDFCVDSSKGSPSIISICGENIFCSVKSVSLSSSLGALKPATLKVMINLCGNILSHSLSVLHCFTRLLKTSLYHKLTLFTGLSRLIWRTFLPRRRALIAICTKKAVLPTPARASTAPNPPSGMISSLS